jgi:aminoglycoside 6'-N-acetyltransferase
VSDPARFIGVSLRPAALEDLPLLQRWDEAPHVVASDPNDDWNWEAELARTVEWREQLIAEVDGVPVGFVQIIDPAEEESHYWGDVPANLRAIRFYERLGFEPVERRRFGQDDCIVYRLDRSAWTRPGGADDDDG